MNFLMLIFALTLSLDSFGVGISYGLQKIKIQWQSLLIICCCSSLVLALSMIIGRVIAMFISATAVEMLGGTALCLMGMFILVQNWIKNAEGDNGAICNVTIKSLGVVIQILKEPAEADLDASGTISGHEAVFLGMALALDSFGAGIGAAMIGFNVLLTSALVGMCCFVFLNLGIQLGQRAYNLVGAKKIALLPGFILLGIGLTRFFK